MVEVDGKSSGYLHAKFNAGTSSISIFFDSNFSELIMQVGYAGLLEMFIGASLEEYPSATCCSLEYNWEFSVTSTQFFSKCLLGVEFKVCGFDRGFGLVVS